MLGAFTGIYDEFKSLQAHNPQTLADISAWMQDETQEILQNWFMDSNGDGQMVVEVGLRCGSLYLIEM
jgi:hypothetical protein